MEPGNESRLGCRSPSSGGTGTGPAVAPTFGCEPSRATRHWCSCAASRRCATAPSHALKLMVMFRWAAQEGGQAGSCGRRRGPHPPALGYGTRTIPRNEWEPALYHPGTYIPGSMCRGVPLVGTHTTRPFNARGHHGVQFMFEGGGG